MIRIVLALVAIALVASLHAQTITQGPVVGGVTDTSARIYVRTGGMPAVFELQLSTDTLFTAPISIVDSTRRAEYGSVIVNVGGLEADTTYHYRVLFAGVPDARTGRFRTFRPAGQEGYSKIVFGSCNYFGNPGLFQQITDHDPDLFVHLGDWGYAPATYGAYHTTSDSLGALSFALRYDDDMMEQYVLPHMPVDYIYDDDYTQNGAGGWTFPAYSYDDSGPETVHNLVVNDLPPGVREGAIEAWVRHFPGYAPVDTAHGIHHSIRLGNIEIFMVDNRLNATSELDAFRVDSTTGRWVFDPPPGHTNLGAEQRDWLLNALQTSDADWKIIGSGVAFNAALRDVLDLAMEHQDTVLAVPGYSGSGMTLATSIAYMWAGYPEDIDPLVDLSRSGTVRDLVHVTGDTHSSALDSGENSGVPEMNTSGLAAGDEAFFNILLSLLADLFDQPQLAANKVWDGGGNGIGNANFTDTYGVVEVFDTDSLRMCIYDELAQNLGCITFYHSSRGGGNSITGIEQVLRDHLVFLTYPNPARDALRVEWRAPGMERLVLSDDAGRVLRDVSVRDARHHVLNIADLAPGVYSLQATARDPETGVVTTGGRRFVKR